MRQANDGLRVGDLADASGLSVRTVRYYDQIGLLTPSRRTSGGHRVYDEHDVRRLYRICVLRRMGLSLADISQALDDPTEGVREAMQGHLDLLDREVAAAQATRRRVARMGAALAADRPPAMNELLDTLEEMTMPTDNLQARISILVYEEIPAIHRYLGEVFGLGRGRLDYDEVGRCVHGEVQVGDGVIWLHRATAELALASPRSLGGTNGIIAVMVEDVDAHHRHAVDRGADVVYPPLDQPYGYREYSARDPEGGLWSFMQAIA